ncbi:MAG: vitamin B12 dependent-methionine synthase activation domain-containing protein [Leptospirales bacterium]
MPSMRIGTPVFFNNIPYEIEERQILREMRIPRKSFLRELDEPALATQIKKAINEGYQLIQGKGVFRTLTITGIQDHLVTTRETNTLFTGEKMVKLLKYCDFATLLVATIGPQLEERVDKLASDEPAYSFFLERVGAWMADYMGIHIDRVLEKEINRFGYGRTFRFGVGYGDWPLSSQKEVMELTEASKIGISLTDSFIMIPRLSVSAVIGWERTADAPRKKPLRDETDEKESDE